MKLGIDGEIDAALKSLVAEVQGSLAAIHNGNWGAGAGVVWRSDGLILTNDHVLGGGRHGRAFRHRLTSPPPGDLRITLADGREFTARILARKADFDLALLKIQTSGLQPARIADSRRLRVGMMVLAVGHPWGQRNTVTAGILSGLGKARTRQGGQEVPILRTDVQLAPGNSGGPLVDLTGGVVGINTLVIGGDLGVAIPSHVAAAFLEEVLGEKAGGRPA
jgi:serine protease Do